MSLPLMNLRRIQVCKTRDFFCKLAFFANLPRRHDTPWHFARTDIGCPRSRAKKMYALARREMSRRARSLKKNNHLSHLLSYFCRRFFSFLRQMFSYRSLRCRPLGPPVPEFLTRRI